MFAYTAKSKYFGMSNSVIERNQWCSRSIGVRNQDWELSYDNKDGLLVWCFKSKQQLTMFELAWD